jgi:hypothetical protein
MQITIDTQKDSKEDIRKAIAFLSSLSDNVQEHHANIFENSSLSETPSSNAPVNAFGSMFGDDSPPITSSSSTETPKIEEEKEDEDLELMTY